MNRLIAGALGAIGILAADGACATIIDFKGATVGQTVASYIKDGFTLSLTGYYGTGSATIGGTTANPYLMVPGATTIVVTGGTFTLGTFSYGNLTIDTGAGFLRVYGYLNGQKTLDTTYDTFKSPVQTRDLATGSQVFDRLEFTQQTFSASGAAIDDIVLNAVGGVPEPATWAMFLLGFGAIGTAARRRNYTIRFA